MTNTRRLYWWQAMASLNQFEDGALVIEDSTLSVNAGATVNLRVRLGTRPRSDVTVALTEASSLISLGGASLTFTRDNWDVYQSVTVTASGNRQEFSTAVGWSYNGPSRRWSTFNSTTGRQVNASLTPGADRWINSIGVTITGALIVGFATTSADVVVSLAGADLSSTFETSGSVSIAYSGTEATAPMAGQDLAEPYQVNASPASDGVALYNALPGTGDDAAVTVTLRDYAPGSAAISLSASGPSEYDGVTGSATVTVT